MKEIAKGEIDPFLYPDEIIGYKKIEQAKRKDKKPGEKDKKRVKKM